MRNLTPAQLAATPTGCRLHEDCLTCPFLRCYYDDPAAWLRDSLAAGRAEMRRQRVRLGLSIKEIAAIHGVSTRTAGRAIKGGV